jgi:hypothetical protein
VSENGAPMRVAIDADGKHFERLFLNTLNIPEQGK